MKCASIVGAQQMNLTSWRLYARRKPKNCQRQSLFPEGSSKVEVSFWTEDVPELICVGTFSKKRDGSVSYRLDFSESTL